MAAREFIVKVINWKSDNVFTFRRKFRSAYNAWRWADRFNISRKSQYVVTIWEEGELL